MGAGALAGVIAGVVLAVFMTGLNVAKGVDPWVGAKAAAAPLLGPSATQPGFARPFPSPSLKHLVFGLAPGLAFVPLERRVVSDGIAPWIDARRRGVRAA